jgi:tetratricopeptide (TPR) repeat protein
MKTNASWWYAAAVAIMTTVLFQQVRTFEFVNYDDHEYVTENAHVRSGLTSTSVFWALTSLDSHNWHPLTWLSLELDYTLYGLNPAGFHVTNVALHLANTLLLFWVLRRITGETARSAAVAALFALHPLHVESVAWVSERKDVLSTLFWLLTTLVYVRYVARPSLGRYSIVVASFVLGLSAKAMLMTLPCVLLLLDFWPLGRLSAERGTEYEDRNKPAHPRSPLRVPRSALTRLFLEKIPLFAVSFLCGLVAIAAQSKQGAIVPLVEFPVSDRVANALVAYVAYVGKAVWPSRLAVFYPYARHGLAVAIAAAAVLLAISLLVDWRRSRQPYLAVGWLWYVVTLAPVIGLVQVGEQALADRYTYVPLIGLLIAVVWGVADLTAHFGTSRWLVATLAAVAFIALGTTTWTQLGYWRDSVQLWRHAIEVGGENHVACTGLGVALRQHGLTDEALQWLEKAAALAPAYAPARDNLGLVLFRLGRFAESRIEYEALLRIEPGYARAHRMLAAVFKAEGNLEDAAAEGRTAVRIDPNDWQSHWELAKVLAKQGADDEASVHLREAKRLNPQLAKRQTARAAASRHEPPDRVD